VRKCARFFLSFLLLQCQYAATQSNRLSFARLFFFRFNLLSQRFELKLASAEEVLPSSTPRNTSKIENDSWYRLSLQYSVDWPLNILLPRPILAKYDSLFRFLFLLTRVRVSLIS
jgi:hypothetical protein